MKNAVFFPNNKNKAGGYDQLSILWLKNRQTQYTYPIYKVIKHSTKEFRNSTKKQTTLSYIRKHLEFKLDQGMNNNLTYRYYKKGLSMLVNFLHRQRMGTHVYTEKCICNLYQPRKCSKSLMHTSIKVLFSD